MDAPSREAVRRARTIGHRRRLAESLVALGLLDAEAGSSAAARTGLEEAVELARESGCRESVVAGLSALARLERTSGSPARAVRHARRAIELARTRQLHVIEVWARMELGLLLLAQGNLEEAPEHTHQAVASVSPLRWAWIGTGQMHRAHSRVLQALGRGEARQQARLADAVIREKAERIRDLEVRRR